MSIFLKTDEEKISYLTRFHPYYKIELNRAQNDPITTEVNLKIKITDIERLLKTQITLYNDDYTNVVFTPFDDFTTIFKYEYYKGVFYIRMDSYHPFIALHFIPKEYNAENGGEIILKNDDYIKQRALPASDHYMPLQDYSRDTFKVKLTPNDDSTADSYGEYLVPLPYDLARLQNLQIDVEYVYHNDGNKTVVGILDTHERDIDQITQDLATETLLKYSEDTDTYTDAIIKTQTGTVDDDPESYFKLVSPQHTNNQAYSMTLKYINDDMYMEEKDNDLKASTELAHIKYAKQTWGEFNKPDTTTTISVLEPPANNLYYDGIDIDLDIETFITNQPTLKPNGFIKILQKIDTKEPTVLAKKQCVKGTTGVQPIHLNIGNLKYILDTSLQTPNEYTTYTFTAQFIGSDYYEKSEATIDIKVYPKKTPHFTCAYDNSIIYRCNDIIGVNLQFYTGPDEIDTTRKVSLMLKNTVVPVSLSKDMNDVITEFTCPNGDTPSYIYFKLPQTAGHIKYQLFFKGDESVLGILDTNTLSIDILPLLVPAKTYLTIEADQNGAYQINQDICITARLSAETLNSAGETVIENLSTNDSDYSIDLFDNNNVQVGSFKSNEVFKFYKNKKEGGTSYMYHAKFKGNDVYEGCTSSPILIVINTEIAEPLPTRCLMTISKANEDTNYYVNTPFNITGTVESINTKDGVTNYGELSKNTTIMHLFKCLPGGTMRDTGKTVKIGETLAISETTSGLYSYYLSYLGDNKNYGPSDSADALIKVIQKKSTLNISYYPTTINLDKATPDNSTTVTVVLNTEEDEGLIEVATNSLVKYVEEPVAGHKKVEFSFKPLEEKIIFDVTTEGSDEYLPAKKQLILGVPDDVVLTLSSIGEPTPTATDVYLKVTATKFDTTRLLSGLPISFYQDGVLLNTEPVNTLNGVAKYSLDMTNVHSTTVFTAKSEAIDQLYNKSESNELKLNVRTKTTKITLSSSITTETKRQTINNENIITFTGTLLDTENNTIANKTLTLFQQDLVGSEHNEKIVTNSDGTNCSGLTASDGTITFTTTTTKIGEGQWSFDVKYVSPTADEYISSTSTEYIVLELYDSSKRLVEISTNWENNIVTEGQKLNIIANISDYNHAPINGGTAYLAIKHENSPNDDYVLFKNQAIVNGKSDYVQNPAVHGTYTVYCKAYQATIGDITYPEVISKDTIIKVVGVNETLLKLEVEQDNLVAQEGDFVFHATLYSAVNKASVLKQKTITLTLYGANNNTLVYTAITNDQGIATFTIPNNAQSFSNWTGIATYTNNNTDINTATGQQWLNATSEKVPIHITIAENKVDCVLLSDKTEYSSYIVDENTNTTIKLYARLENKKTHVGISNKNIVFSGPNITGTQTVVTNENGEAMLDVVVNTSKSAIYQAQFDGSGFYTAISALNICTVNLRTSQNITSSEVFLDMVVAKSDTNLYVLDEGQDAYQYITITGQLAGYVNNKRIPLQGYKLYVFLIKNKGANNEQYLRVNNDETQQITDSNGQLKVKINNTSHVAATFEYCIILNPNKIAHTYSPLIDNTTAPYQHYDKLNAVETQSQSVQVINSSASKTQTEIHLLNNDGTICTTPDFTTTYGENITILLHQSGDPNSPITNQTIKWLYYLNQSAEPVSLLTGGSATTDSNGRCTLRNIWTQQNQSTTDAYTKLLYAGNENYEWCNRIYDMINNTQPTTVELSDSKVQHGDALIATVKDSHGNPITELNGHQLQLLNANGQVMTLQSGDGILNNVGQASIRFPWEQNTYNMTIKCPGTNYYKESSKTYSNFVITAKQLTLTLTNTASGLVAGSDANFKLNATLKSSNVSVSNKQIRVTGPMFDQTLTTDANGNASFTYSALGSSVIADTYTFYANLVDTTYTAAQASTIVIVANTPYVPPSEPTVTVLDTSLNLSLSPTTIYAETQSTVVLSATLKDSNGNPLSNKTVIFSKANSSSSYTATTNSNGIAQYTDVGSLTSAGTLVYSAVFEGTTGYNAAPKVNQTLNIAKRTLTLQTPSSVLKVYPNVPFSIRVVDNNGNPVADMPVNFIYVWNSDTKQIRYCTHSSSCNPSNTTECQCTTRDVHTTDSNGYVSWTFTSTSITGQLITAGVSIDATNGHNAVSTKQFTINYN